MADKGDSDYKALKEQNQKSMKLQAQIRQNSEELSAYLTDLNSWEKKISKKDKELLAQGGKKPRAVVTKTSSDDGHAAGSSAASAPMPAPNKTAGSGAMLTPASLVSQHAIPVVAPQAVPRASGEASTGGMEAKVREQGNAEYQKGNFPEAIKLYTKCIGLKSKNYLGFSNRAMACLKTKDFINAERDCKSALNIEPGHIKSYIRRATARNALGKHRGALQDLDRAYEVLLQTNAADVGAGGGSASFINDSKLIKSEILKTKELLRNAVSHAPMVPIATEWCDFDGEGDGNGDDNVGESPEGGEVEGGNVGEAVAANGGVPKEQKKGKKVVHIPIEAGPEPRPMSM